MTGFRLSVEELRLAVVDIRRLRWTVRQGLLDRLAAYCEQHAEEIAAISDVSPPTSPLPDTARRVVEAAVIEEKALTIFRAGGGGERGLPHLRARWEAAQDQTSAAVRKHLATLRPADLLAMAVETLRAQDQLMTTHFKTPDSIAITPDYADAWRTIRAAILLIERSGKEDG